jgi:hypothetical protein
VKVEWALACRYAEIHDGLGTFVGAGIDNVGVPTFPAQVQVVFAIRCTVGPTEGGQQHSLRVRILDDHLNQVGGQIEGAVDAPERPHLLEGWEGHPMLHLAVRWEAPAAGVFTVVFETDDNSYSVPIVVHSPGSTPA